MIFQLDDYQVRALNAVTAYARKYRPNRRFLHSWFFHIDYAFATDGTTILLCNTTYPVAEPDDRLYAFAPVRVARTLTEHALTFDTESARVAGMKSEQQDLAEVDLAPPVRRSLRALLGIHTAPESREAIAHLRGVSAPFALLGRITEALSPVRSDNPFHLAGYSNYVRINESPTLLTRWSRAPRTLAFSAIHPLEMGEEE